MINIKRTGDHVATPVQSSRAEALRLLGMLTVAWVDGRYHHVTLPAQYRAAPRKPSRTTVVA